MHKYNIEDVVVLIGKNKVGPPADDFMAWTESPPWPQEQCTEDERADARDSKVPFYISRDGQSFAGTAIFTDDNRIVAVNSGGWVCLKVKTERAADVRAALLSKPL